MKYTWIWMALLGLFLAGCGGGSSSDTSATPGAVALKINEPHPVYTGDSLSPSVGAVYEVKHALKSDARTVTLKNGEANLTRASSAN